MLTLNTIPFFQGLPKPAQEKLLSHARLQAYQPGESLFQIGDDTLFLFALISGYACFQHYSEEGKKITLGMVDAGKIAGDMELVDPTPRQTRALVLSPTEAILIPKVDFLASCREYPFLYERLLQIYSRRLQHAAKLMLLRNDEQILASVLLGLANKLGIQNKQCVEFKIPFSQEELASYVGIPRQRLNKMLNQLKQQGILETHYNRITLWDLSKLERLVPR